MCELTARQTGGLRRSKALNGSSSAYKAVRQDRACNTCLWNPDAGSWSLAKANKRAGTKCLVSAPLAFQQATCVFHEHPSAQVIQAALVGCANVPAPLPSQTPVLVHRHLQMVTKPLESSSADQASHSQVNHMQCVQSEVAPVGEQLEKRVPRQGPLSARVGDIEVCPRPAVCSAHPARLQRVVVLQSQ